ncbi:MAG: aryl-sulfate sulfotransferase [Rhodospirillales bacterium RIFCSPLOWO2_12_FULL_58_28]|nr:MAG: aryl-sulfate sulfotransferase [Rhodospirillales bacterium RIFCSPLOWO2_02_FULL_58_16]OHC78244.1 MAG: aryl-sulfate sulfotransferase [Rhodospirillales bacterium RIFCSPLOWO2_12_FULL_58_28]
MASPAPARLCKRSVLIAGHATSVSLENAFWEELKRIAKARNLSLNRLIAAIDNDRAGNLSGAIRVFVLETLRQNSA